MSKESRNATTVRNGLERIARALDQPITAFFDGGGSALREAETLTLLRGFELIKDRETRSRCIAFVNEEANREQRERPAASGELAI